MANYVSQYTGAQIDQAIAAYLTGNIKSMSTFYIEATSNFWKNSTSSTFDGRYYTDVSASGSLYVGIYPDIFIITTDGQKIIPEVDYSQKNGNFKIYSNTMAAGTVVLLGTSLTGAQVTFTVRAGNPSSYSERYTKSVNYGDNFYTIYSGGLGELKCASLTSKVTDNSGDVGLYLNGTGNAVIGSDIIVPGGIYYIIAG